MKTFEENEFIFFGEWAPFAEGRTPSKEEAKSYLMAWKKNLILKLRTELYNYELHEEDLGERAPQYSGPLCLYGELYLKMVFKKKLPDQII